MGLLRSYENGTQTDLKSLRFGRDRRGGGSSNEPYLYNPIFGEGTKALQTVLDVANLFGGNQAVATALPNLNLNPPNFIARGVKPGNIIDPPPIGANSDLIIRGGAIVAGIRAADDIRRMARMFFDGKNVTGKLFRVKQLALSRVSPKTQQTIGFLPQLLNEGIYSPINTMLQAGGNFFGLHIDKQGPLLGELPRYADIMVDFGTDEDDERVGTTSRLAGLLYSYHRGERKKPKSLKNFRLQNVNNDKRAYNFLYAYSGGPGSILGFGQTRLYLSTDRNNVPIVLPNLKGNYYFSLTGEDQNIYKPLSGYTSRLELLYLREYTQTNWENTSYFETFTGLFTIGTSNIFDSPLITLSSKNNQYYYQGFDRNTFKGPEGQVEEKLLNLFNTGYTDIVKWNRTSNFNAGSSIFNLATKNIGDAPIRTRYIELNGFSSEEAFFTNTEGELVDPNTYLNNGATSRLKFLFKKQYNTEEWINDTRFFEGRGFFNLSTKNDNVTPIRTLYTLSNYEEKSIDLARYPNNIINRWADRKSYSRSIIYNSTEKTIDQELLNVSKSYLPLVDKDNNTITRYTFHNRDLYFATNQRGQTPLRAVRERLESGRQWGIYDLLLLDTNGLVANNYAVNFPEGRANLNDSLIPIQAPSNNQDFRKRISVYSNIGLDYNAPDTRLESRVNMGDPGGKSSKIAYKLDPITGKKKNYSSATLTVPNAWGSVTTTRNEAGAIIEDKGEAGSWANKHGSGYAKAVNKVNMIPVYQGATTLPPSVIPKNDLVNFAIGVNINDSPSNTLFNWIHFPAHLNDISDTYSSDWSSTQYVGRTEKFYKYGGGFERKISTSFIVAAESKAELIPIYKKLNYLASSIAGDYTRYGYMTGNLMKLSIGSYVHMVPGFLQGITYTMKQGYPWEIAVSGFYDAEGKTIVDDSVKELCHYIEVTGFDFTVIHNFLPRVANDRPMNTGRRFISLRNATGTNWSYTGEATGIIEGLDIDNGSLEVVALDSEFAVGGTDDIDQNLRTGDTSNPVSNQKTDKALYNGTVKLDINGMGQKTYEIVYKNGRAYGITEDATGAYEVLLTDYFTELPPEIQEQVEAFTYQDFETKI